MNLVRGMLGRFGWGVADQAISSATNFGLGLTVARNVNTEALGIFAITFSTYMIALSLSRPATTDPLVIRYSTSSEHEWRRASSAATGTAILIGVLFGVASVSVGWLIGGSMGASFIALGATLPGLLVQEAWRFVFFSGSRGSQALVNDLIWGLAMVGLFLLLLSMGNLSVTSLVAAWGTGASVAAVAGAVQARLMPRPRLALIWHRQHKDLSVPLVGESIIRTGSGSLATYLIGFISGVSALGALRGADILLGPTRVMVMGLGLVAVPESARGLAQSPGRLLHTMIWISSAAGATVVAWGFLLYLLPESAGRALLGVSWDKAHALLVPMTLAYAGDAIATGPTSGLLALEVAGRVLRTRIVGAVILVGAAGVGAALGGAYGAANGFAVSTVVMCAIWWRQAVRTLRRRQIAPTDAAEHPTLPGTAS